MKEAAMRIGIDLGGKKNEARGIDKSGKGLRRYRVLSPREDYARTIAAMVGRVQRIEGELGAVGTVGAGIPGSVSRRTGLVKNANSTWLNGMPLDRDLSTAMGREVRVANDANCFAVSEATDGAAAGQAGGFGGVLGGGGR